MSSRKLIIATTACSTYLSAVYLSYHYLQKKKSPEDDVDENGKISYISNPNRAETFQKIACCYDKDISKDEIFLGINLLRRWMLYFHSDGKVLEVASGTSRNINYYPERVEKIVLTDNSQKMLMETLKKIETMPNREKFSVLKADASNLANFSDDYFDTVVDTFGLCSYDDPVAVLNEMKRVCKSKTGKILLLEHGQTNKLDFLSKHLDDNAERHARKWGCVWNRDIPGIIEKAGLDVEYMNTWHFGTTYYIICRK